MNGPTIGALVLILGVGVFMFIAWYRRNSLCPHDTRRQRLVRAVVVLLWLSAVIALPVLANDLPQPGLVLYVNLAILSSLQLGYRDLRVRKNLGTVAGKDHS
ncbi:hypothetical protein [Pengzhenrongella sp.]|uniref:hypothetical protein n=1 Tax=Pengzhenrongella sp. TaxID=2888820 RepID=UPI002F95AAFB